MGVVRVLLLGFFAFDAFAQLQSGELRVHVSDPSGLPLQSAVSVVSEASRTHRDGQTNDSGSYTFQHLPFGIYRVTIEQPGFQPLNESVEVRSSVPKDLRIQLSLRSSATEVTVNAPETLVDPHRTGVDYAISTQQIREQQSAIPGRGVLDAINDQPGWLFEANGVLHPRGSEYQTQFVVDGMPMEENRSAAFAPALDSDAVSEMTVLTGNIPAEYGRKLGGVIEVTTTHDVARGFHGDAGVGGGSFDTQQGFASLTYGFDRSVITLNGAGSRTDRFLDPPVLANFTNSGTTDNFDASYSIDLGPADRLTFSATRATSRFDVPNENVQQLAGQRQDRDTPEVDARVGWSHVLAPNALLNLRFSVEDLSANLWSNTSATPIIAAQQRGFRRSYLNTTVSVQKGAHDLKFGADAIYAPVTEGLQYAITDPSYFDPDTAPTFQFLDHRLDREQAAFAQDNMHFGNLSISAGLRFDHYSLVVNDHAFSPRTGIAYYVKPLGVLLRLSYDRVFQTPALENLLLASSSEVDQVSSTVLRIPVQPSRGNYFEAGFTKAIANKARLEASFYRRNFKNFADDDVFLNTGIGFPISFHAAKIQGVDVKLDLPHWGKLSGYVSYSNLVGTAELPVAGGLFLGSDAGTALAGSGWFPVTQDQRNTARARARYQVTTRLWAAVSAQYGSGLPVETTFDPSLVEQYGPQIINRVNFSAGRVRPNFSLNVNAGAELWKREKATLNIEGEIENLTDRVNVIDFAGLFSGTAVAQPRSGNLRLRISF